MAKCEYVKAKKKKKWLKPLVIIFIIFGIIFSYFHFYVNPELVNSNIAKIKAYTIQVLNSSTSKTIASNDYDNLITIEKDGEGNVTLLQVNSLYVNKLNNDIMTSIQNTLNENSFVGYKLPLGSFLGVPILNGIGPQVQLNIVPIGNVNTKYRSQIASLSINQSYHKIYLSISVDICIILPLYTQTITVSNQLLIGENLIVGKIPSTYLNTDNLTNALNLIPN